MKTLKDYLAETIRRYGAVGSSPGMGYTLESSGTVDMKGKKCTTCKKGTYEETSQHDDMDGVLHCTKCRKEVKRHQSAKSTTSKEMQDRALEKTKQTLSKPENMAVLKRLKTKEDVSEGITETADGVKYGVFAKGGSVGSQRFRDDPLKTFDTKEEAIADARRRRSGLSKGERGYYRMSYVVKPIKGVTEASRGFRGVGGAREREDDERHDLDPSDWYIVKDGKLLKASIYPRQEAQARAEGFSPTREEARAKASNKGVAEASPRQHPKRYQRAIDSFNRFMDEPESTPKDDLQSRHDQTKNRIKTNTMAGPKGQLPEAGKDVMRHSGDTTVKIVKRRGVPVGEIGIDAEASPGNGQYYVKLYDGSYDAVGFDTAKEALEELKYAISSSMEEDAASDDPLLAKSVDLAPVGALEENAELRLILQRAKLIE